MQKNWRLLPTISKSVDRKIKSYPPIIRQLLFNRGIVDPKLAKDFLAPSFEKFISANKLYDTKKATSAISNAIKGKKKIFIHGDYDVDGICATSILWDFLHRCAGAKVLPYIPSRFDEGYGMTNQSISAMVDQGAELIISVDCGIRDAELIEKWSKNGIDIIVTDHHELRKEGKKIILPAEAKAIVHPSYPGHKYPFTSICGAAVAWKLVQALAEQGALDVDTDRYLDLVALATVCDVMPLVDENRSIVRAGLKKIRETERVGLRRLIYDAGLAPKDIEVYHLGFLIGPRLNAAGRLDHALEAVRLLVTNSLSQARELSEKLHNLNQERQYIQESIYKNALQQIEEIGIERKLFFAWGEDWAEGVIGIVAGKISETYHRPVLIATRKGETYTGSARSTEAFNIIKAINSQAGILERFGGHPQAAGFTVKSENIERFRDNLLDVADHELGDEDVIGELVVDCEIDLEDLTWELYNWIERFSPFGFGNPAPRFVMNGVVLSDISLVGSERRHVKVAFFDKDAGSYISGIGFGLAEACAEMKEGQKVDVVFAFEVNEWNGEKKLQLNIRDIRVAPNSSK